MKHFNKKNIVILLSTVVVIGLIWAFVFLNGMSKNNMKANSSDTGTLAKQKRSAVDGVTQILLSAEKSPDDRKTDVRLTDLQKGDYSAVDNSLLEKIHFSEDATEEFKIATLQTLISMADIVRTRGKDIKTSDDAWKYTYSVPENNIVYVPLSLYAGNGAAFSFEMINIDGNWKLNPYSLVDAVKLSALVQQGNNPTSTPPK